MNECTMGENDMSGQSHLPISQSTDDSSLARPRTSRECWNCDASVPHVSLDALSIHVRYDFVSLQIDD